MSRVWTSLDLITWTKDFFVKKGIESPRLEAELMLAEVLGVPRIRLYVDFEKPVPQDKLAAFREYVKRRAETREPLQYILGHTDFIDLRLKVTKAVLIPRPETELLAVWAAERLAEIACPEALLAAAESSASPIPTPTPLPPSTETPAVEAPPAAAIPAAPAVPAIPDRPVAALDLCTGSGCIALYLAARRPSAHVVATDISDDALTVARENAQALKVEARVEFLAGDLFAALPAASQGSFDLIVSNPPYIDPALRETLAPEVREHEPERALFAGERGLEVVRRAVAGAAAWLKPGGWLGVEFGVDQADAVRKFAEDAAAYERIEIRRDAAQLPRMLLARKRMA